MNKKVKYNLNRLFKLEQRLNKQIYNYKLSGYSYRGYGKLLNNYIDKILYRLTIDENNCWIYSINRKLKSYGRITIKDKNIQVTRYVYWWFYKKSKGLSFIKFKEKFNNIVIRHTCDNPMCCNPKHLRKGSYQDNTNDMIERGNLKSKITKLTENPNIVLKILKASGTHKEISIKFKVCESTVWGIKKGYRHSKITNLFW